MLWFLFSTALASDVAQMDQVKQVSEHAWDIMDGFAVIKAFLIDESLVEAGHAPADWAQPPMEAYETELGLRPSMLPFGHYMDLATAGHCSVDDGDQYLAWEEERLSALETAADL